eukprot:gene11433-4600_t
MEEEEKLSLSEEYLTFDESCAFCLEEKITNPAIVLPCFHSFCVDCVSVWLNRSKTCPLCKCLIKSLIYNIHSKNDYQIINYSSSDELSTIPNHPQRIKVYFDDFQVKEEPEIHNIKFSKEFYNKNKINLEKKFKIWVQRDLETIFKSYKVENVTNMILRLISIFELDSNEFYDHVYQYLNKFTDKFISELILFSRTKFNLDVYDMKVELISYQNLKKRKREIE